MVSILARRSVVHRNLTWIFNIVMITIILHIDFKILFFFLLCGKETTRETKKNSCRTENGKKIGISPKKSDGECERWLVIVRMR